MKLVRIILKNCTVEEGFPNPDQNNFCFAMPMFCSCFSDRLGYDNDFAWEEARYPGSRNGLTHFRRLDDKTLALLFLNYIIILKVVCPVPLQL